MKIQNYINMEEEPLCLVCGGSDFVRENGHFFCSECQTQCEEFCEQIFEDHGETNYDDGEKLLGTSFAKRGRRQPKAKKKGDDVTSWEIFNFILRGLVDELISSGAPVTVKDTTLQLWAYYLQKMKVAFISKSEALLPDISGKSRVIDIKMIRGLKKKKPIKSNRMSSTHAEFNTTLTAMSDWSTMRIKKKWHRDAKKAFMKKVTEISRNSESSSMDQSSMFDVSEFDDTSSLISASPSFLNNSSDNDNFEDDNEDETEQEHSSIKSEEMNTRKSASVENPFYLTKSTIVVLLYLALLYEGSQIQISDIIRWVREGHLSYYEAAKFLPETCFAQGQYKLIFGWNYDLPSYEPFRRSAVNLSNMLGMVDWPDPNVSELSKKYVKELQLPDLFSELVQRYVAFMPLSYKFHNSRVSGDIPNYEGRILAILIIIMKLLFGLDGKTEGKISEIASLVNKWMERKKGDKITKLFVWNDWMKQLICRRAVLSNYHFLTKHTVSRNTQSPQICENPFTFINYHNKWSDANVGLEDKYHYHEALYLKVSRPALLNTLSSVLEKLKDPVQNNNVDIDFPQCFTPYSIYIKNILEKSAELEKPLIAESALKILSEDHTKHEIMYLLSPELLSNVTEDHGVQLQVKYKSAQKKPLNPKKLTSRKIKNWGVKYGCYVSVIHCKPARKPRPCPNSDNEESIEKRNIGSIRNDQKKPKEKRHKKIIKRIEKQENVTKGKSGKNENISKSKNLVENHLHLSSKSRKRKRKTTAGISKRKKISKILKFYVPCSKYWVCAEYKNISNEVFETCVNLTFPFSFAWLLEECAFISEMSKLCLYKEVVQLEKLCKNILK